MTTLNSTSEPELELTTTALPGESASDGLYTGLQVVIVIVMSVGIPGNLLTIASVCRYRRLRTAGNIFVMNLSIADGMYYSFSLPIRFATFQLGDKFWNNNEFCVFLGAFSHFLNGASTLCLSAIALNRLLLIRQAKYYDKMYSALALASQLGLIWGTALIITIILPCTDTWGKFIFVPGALSCTFDPESDPGYKATIVTCGFWIPSIFIVVCYSIIYHHFMVNRNKVESWERQQEEQREKNAQSIRKSEVLQKIAEEVEPGQNNFNILYPHLVNTNEAGNIMADVIGSQLLSDKDTWLENPIIDEPYKQRNQQHANNHDTTVKIQSNVTLSREKSNANQEKTQRRPSLQNLLRRSSSTTSNDGGNDTVTSGVPEEELGQNQPSELKHIPEQVSNKLKTLQLTIPQITDYSQGKKPLTQKVSVLSKSGVTFDISSSQNIPCKGFDTHNSEKTLHIPNFEEETHNGSYRKRAFSVLSRSKVMMQEVSPEENKREIALGTNTQDVSSSKADHEEPEINLNVNINNSHENDEKCLPSTSYNNGNGILSLQPHTSSISCTNILDKVKRSDTSQQADHSSSNSKDKEEVYRKNSGENLPGMPVNEKINVTNMGVKSVTIISDTVSSTAKQQQIPNSQFSTSCQPVKSTTNQANDSCHINDGNIILQNNGNINLQNNGNIIIINGESNGRILSSSEMLHLRYEALKQSKRKLAHKQHRRKIQHNVNNKRRRDAIKLTLMMVCIYCLFVICILPYFIVNTVTNAEDSPTAYLLGLMFTWFNGCVNPVVYAMMNAQFRYAYRSILSSVLECCCVCKASDGGGGRGKKDNNPSKPQKQVQFLDESATHM